MRYILKDAQNNMKRMKWVESDVCNEMHKIIIQNEMHLDAQETKKTMR